MSTSTATLTCILPFFMIGTDLALTPGDSGSYTYTEVRLTVPRAVSSLASEQLGSLWTAGEAQLRRELREQQHPQADTLHLVAGRSGLRIEDEDGETFAAPEAPGTIVFAQDNDYTHVVRGTQVVGGFYHEDAKATTLLNLIEALCAPAGVPYVDAFDAIRAEHRRRHPGDQECDTLDNEVDVLTDLMEADPEWLSTLPPVT